MLLKEIVYVFMAVSSRHRQPGYGQGGKSHSPGARETPGGGHSDVMADSFSVGDTGAISPIPLSKVELISSWS